MTASGVATTMTTTTVTTTAMAAATTMGECRDVRHDTKRAHRNAHRQNSYCFLHGASPIEVLKPSLAARAATDVTSTSHLTTISAASF